MSEKLKQCPFCKGEFAFDFEAKNFRCGTCGATVPPDPYARTVNTRPIEDELTARIAELEATVEVGADIAKAYENRVSEIVALSNETVGKLNSRIAELEAAQRWIPVSERLPNKSGWYLTGLVYFWGSPYSGEVYFDAETELPWRNSVRDEVYCWLDGVPELPQPPEVQDV